MEAIAEKVQQERQKAFLHNRIRMLAAIDQAGRSLKTIFQSQMSMIA